MCCAVADYSDAVIRTTPVNNETVHVSSGSQLSHLASPDQTRPLPSLHSPSFHTECFRAAVAVAAVGLADSGSGDHIVIQADIFFEREENT